MYSGSAGSTSSYCCTPGGYDCAVTQRHNGATSNRHQRSGGHGHDCPHANGHNRRHGFPADLHRSGWPG